MNWKIKYPMTKVLSRSQTLIPPPRQWLMNLEFIIYEFPITVKECITSISACCWLSLQEVSFILPGSVHVCLVPSGSLICTYHTVYGSIAEYLLKLPQHGTSFLLSETVPILLTSSKSTHFPDRCYFTSHLISGEFLPTCSNRLKCSTWVSLILGPSLSNSFIHTREEVNSLTDSRCLVHIRSLAKHFKKYHRKIECIHCQHRLAQTSLWLGAIPVLLYKRKKAALFSVIPFTLLIGFPSTSTKCAAGPFSKGNRKGQFFRILWQDTGGKFTESQDEPSGLTVPCHLGSCSKHFIPLLPNAAILFLKQKITWSSIHNQALLKSQEI